MRMNALRKELAALLDSVPARRPPALRRSAEAEWLYATDFPAAGGEGAQEALLERLREAGWEYAETAGWIQVRKSAAEPPEGWYEGGFGPEARCCLSLLERHAATGDPGTVRLTLVKAGEQGSRAYEDACAKLHREWAAMLRRKEPLPAVSRRYFGG